MAAAHVKTSKSLKGKQFLSFLTVFITLNQQHMQLCAISICEDVSFLFESAGIAKIVSTPIGSKLLVYQNVTRMCSSQLWHLIFKVKQMQNT